MRRLTLTVPLMAGLITMCAITPEPETEWIDLFNGKDLSGWKANLAPDSYTVSDGVLKVHNTSEKYRSHLFYVGEQKEGFVRFKDFELKLIARAEPNSNSGIFFHTDGSLRDQAKHLGKGYEVQLHSAGKGVNTTGALYAIKAAADSSVDETDWFELTLKVQGKRIITRINGDTVVDYTEPENPERPPARKNRILDPDGGALAIQAHDTNSVWYFKRIMIRPLDEVK